MLDDFTKFLPLYKDHLETVLTVTSLANFRHLIGTMNWMVPFYTNIQCIENTFTVNGPMWSSRHSSSQDLAGTHGAGHG